MATVQYTSTSEVEFTDFEPGRQLPLQCERPMPNTRSVPDQHRCLLGPHVGSNAPQLSEFAKISANKSTTNRIYTKPEGGSLIFPARFPLDLNFRAISLGASTSCKVVTEFCDMEWDIDQYNLKTNRTGSDVVFICEVERAGMNWKGYLSQIDNPEVCATAKYGFCIRYYTNTTHSTYDDTRNPITKYNSEFWWSIVFGIDFQFIPDLTAIAILEDTIDSEDTNATYRKNKLPTTFGLVPRAGEDGAAGILSCSTALSDVVRSIRADYSGDLTHLFESFC